MANNFFKHNDKVYSENLNDSVLIGNSFSLIVDIGLPGDTGGVFPNSDSVVKAKVADVSVTPNSNLSIGETVSNTSGSSQEYRLTVYPNFNRFGGFQSVSLDGDGTFFIANKGGNAPIVDNLDYDDLSDVPELKVLKEYDIVVIIPDEGVVSGLDFVFQSSSADVESSINMNNITGLNDRLNAIETFDENIFDIVYPVGSIYMSVNSTNPSALFGGTWERIKDKFLLASGDTYTGGSTGGEANHTLTISEMPNHAHYENANSIMLTNITTNGRLLSESGGKVGANGQMSTQYTTGYNGGGQAHNNMPPYLAIYIWKRIS